MLVSLVRLVYMHFVGALIVHIRMGSAVADSQNDGLQ